MQTPRSRRPWLRRSGTHRVVSLLLRRRALGVVGRGRRIARISNPERSPPPPSWCCPINTQTTMHRWRRLSRTSAVHTNHSVPATASSPRKAIPATWLSTVNACMTTAGKSLAPKASTSTSRPTAQARQSSISAAVAEFADHRAAIEQAKGVVMYVYRIDADAAFELLRWRSARSQRQAARPS